MQTSIERFCHKMVLEKFTHKRKLLPTTNSHIAGGIWDTILLAVVPTKEEGKKEWTKLPIKTSPLKDDKLVIPDAHRRRISAADESTNFSEESGGCLLDLAGRGSP